MVEGFAMRVEIKTGEGPNIRIQPRIEWQTTTVTTPAGPIEVDPDYYVTARRVE